MVVMNTNPKLTPLRDAAITASGIVPAAKAWLAGMKFLKQPHFTDGCVVAPAADVPKPAAALVGRALSQPGVRLSTGDTAALDTVLGSGWALLRFPAGSNGNFEVQSLATDGHDGGAPVTVTDTTGAFTSLSGTGVSLVVRPDRYVATATTPSGEPAALRSLAAYVPGLMAQASTAEHTR